MNIAIRSPHGEGIYAGIVGAEGDKPDGALILLNATPPAKLNWSDARKWAEALGDGARLPTRCEAALLYANAKATMPTDEWCWLDEQYSSDIAWAQLFSYGSQSHILKSTECRARAVRRLPLQSFNPSNDAPKPDTTNALLRQILDESKGLRSDLRTVFLGDTGVAS
jgi:hypothetical protein